MTKLYVIGGFSKPGGFGPGDRRPFQRGVILEVDTETGDAETRVEYVSPPEVCPEDPMILFKACTLEGDKLYACTQTEVLIYSFPDFEQIGYLSLPCFNDLHHVRPTLEGSLLVVNTGLDMVVDVTLEGEILREWNVLGEDPWERFSKEIDYRKVPSTKPHKAHPNYTFYLGEDLWVTRFEQRDAVCLTKAGGRIPIGIEIPHDGIRSDGLIYFTTVDGHVVVADEADQRVRDVVDLNSIHGNNKTLGWCRGLMVNGGKVWVGFSRLRPTRFRETLSWVKHGFTSVGTYNTLPTHIACYDLSARKCLQEIDVESSGISAVFSIFSEQ